MRTAFLENCLTVVRSSSDYEEYPCPTRPGKDTLTSSENKEALIRKISAILKLTEKDGTKRTVSVSMWLSVSEMNHLCRVLGLVVYLWEYWPESEAYFMPRRLSPVEYE